MEFRPLAAIGFLSIVECPTEGISGGYLLVTPQGRPLEFQCTAPVRPNRAQEILYGPTLRPFLFGEMIGKAVVDKAQMKPDAILVDSLDALALRDAIDTPVAAIVDGVGNPLERRYVEINGEQLTLARGYGNDAIVLARLFAHPMGLAELAEPFERIRAAIAEARRIAA